MQSHSIRQTKKILIYIEITNLMNTIFNFQFIHGLVSFFHTIIHFITSILSSIRQWSPQLYGSNLLNSVSIEDIYRIPLKNSPVLFNSKILPFRYGINLQFSTNTTKRPTFSHQIIKKLMFCAPHALNLLFLWVYLVKRPAQYEMGLNYQLYI